MLPALDVNLFTELPHDKRLEALYRSMNRLDMRPQDLEFTFGVVYETARSWTVGKIKIPTPVLVALAALEACDPATRARLIVRKPKRVYSENPHAIYTRQKYAEKKALDEELAARPPLSAKQAGMRQKRAGVAA